ncbi:MAG: glycosyltransferase [Acidobacteriota bacterium]
MDSRPRPELSILVPLYNEADNLAPLLDRIRETVAPLGHSYEVVLVDDGSSDGTADLLKEALKSRPNLRAVFFRKNFGQSGQRLAPHAQGSLLDPHSALKDGQRLDLPHFRGSPARLWLHAESLPP